MKLVLLTIAAALLIADDVAPTTLMPGEWRIVTEPTGASLNGQALHDLPYKRGGAPVVCMSAAEAADPVGWFMRESGTGCTFAYRSIERHNVNILAVCPGQAAGDTKGSVDLKGSWARERYMLNFETLTVGENGRMGFTGTIVGRRLGPCPG